MKGEEKMDCLPNIEQVIRMANNATLKPTDKDWNKDQKADFYLGMFCAMRVFMSGVIKLENDWATTDSEKERLRVLEGECFLRLGEIAHIIMDKYDLKTFSTKP